MTFMNGRPCKCWIHLKNKPNEPCLGHGEGCPCEELKNDKDNTTA